MSKPTFSASRKLFYSGGMFFGQHKTEKGEGWRKLECYLPPDYATGTYGEPIQTTAERWLKEFDAGIRKASFIGKFLHITTDGQVMKLDESGEQVQSKAAGLPDKEVDHTVMSREWLLDKFMQLEGFDELLDGLKQEAIDKAIQAAGDINDEYADNSEVPRVEDVINDFFASKPNVRTYLNIRPLRAAFRNLVSTAA